MVGALVESGNGRIVKKMTKNSKIQTPKNFDGECGQGRLPGRGC